MLCRFAVRYTLRLAVQLLETYSTLAKLRLGFRIKSIPEQVSVYPSPQRSVDEIYLLFVGIMVESKSTEGDGWGRFSGAAVP